jgi:hypothetical protein
MGTKPANQKFSVPHAHEITTTRLCDYGCRNIAQYVFNNGKICCSSHTNKCIGKILRISAAQKIIDDKTGVSIREAASIKSLATRTASGVIKSCQIRGGQTRRNNGFYEKLKIRMKSLWDENPWDGRFKSMFKIYKDTGIPYQGSYEYNFLQNLEDLNGIEWVGNNVKRGPGVKYIFNIEEHLYLPDFLIENTIYEIKSKYTWRIDKEKNCKKLERCIDLGYNVIIVINKKEMNLEQARLI